MVVQSATIGMASSYSLSTTRTHTETSRAWIGDAKVSVPRVPEGASSEDATARISEAARSMARDAASRGLSETAKSAASGSVPEGQGRTAVNSQGEEFQLSPEDELKVRLIEELLSQLFGHKVKLSRFKGWRLGSDPEANDGTVGQPPSDKAAQPPKLGWGIEISVQDSETREERSGFQAAGEIRTADGRVLSLSMKLDMVSSTTRESSFLFQAGDAVRKDPLILNFAGNAADLTDATFAFDLEGDGSMEAIAFATGNSAFLARIGGGAGAGNVPVDGSVLFGTESGDGFGDLAKLDQDGNGWVDEADPAWKDLALWSKDEAGNDWVRSLAAEGIGAIHVGKVKTPFELGSGAVAETGIWVAESEARAGTIQHIDLSV